MERRCPSCYNSPIAEKKQKKNTTPPLLAAGAAIFLLLAAYYLLELTQPFSIHYEAGAKVKEIFTKKEEKKPSLPPLDKALYDLKITELANNPPVATTTGSTTPPIKHLWPIATQYPSDGALLPFNRIVAYYGNFYSTQMGVLGEYAPEEMLRRLQGEVEKWKLADPDTPVIPAIHYIAATAQGSAGEDGMYRLRMPSDQIEKAIALANSVNGIVFLDIQVGLSKFETEIPLLEPYLKMPNVHLALDPEFSMKSGNKPGTVIGTMDAADINYASDYLAKLVKEHNLPTKILIIHRFTRAMVTNYKNIVNIPEVQIVMDMDGWGGPQNKISTYTSFIAPEPVEFTGFKLFYKNDLKNPPNRMLTPEELLQLRPQPIYIQYQ